MTLPPLSSAPRALGATSLRVSPIGWGMWRFAGVSVAEAQARVEAALEAGVTLLDTADIYGFDGKGGFGDAEALLGEVLKAAPHLRDRFVLASKGGITPPVPYDSSADYLIAACEASLSRMGVARIDLYQIHRPDLLAHPAEVAGALERLLKDGKIGAVGVSNFTVGQTAALIRCAPFPIVSTQPEFSPLAIDILENGVLDQAMAESLAVLAWSPFGGGRLAEDGGDPRRARVIAALDAVAAASGVSRAAVANAWIMHHPARPIPLIGAQSPARIREAGEAFKVRMTRADWYAILVASRGQPMP